MSKLTHLDDSGKARMVDVGDKAVTDRRARAAGRVRFGDEAFQALSENRLAKGDAMAVARVAAIQAAKETSRWIPLCHAIPLAHVGVTIELDAEQRCALIEATVRATATTGVEMEALVAVQAAALTLYDMAKALDRGIVIEEIRLLEKSGGRSDFQA